MTQDTTRLEYLTEIKNLLKTSRRRNLPLEYSIRKISQMSETEWVNYRSEIMALNCS